MRFLLKEISNACHEKKFKCTETFIKWTKPWLVSALKRCRLNTELCRFALQKIENLQLGVGFVVLETLRMLACVTVTYSMKLPFVVLQYPWH